MAASAPAVSDRIPPPPPRSRRCVPTPAPAPRARAERLRAVVVGGGTGAPMSIRTLLSLGLETSAVVAMADDGGSTGILREEADVTPPGDVRKCIAAFARDPNDPLTRAFKYRFSVARNHTLGNLMLAALEDASGSFPEAVRICERLLDAQGHVYPSTLDRVTLAARTRDGRVLEGQANACRSRTALERVWLEGAGEATPYRPALDAIRGADLVVLGPGSLFTSIIPNLLVPGIVDAVRTSRGHVLFVCSLADMQGETWGLTAREHVEALMDHGMRGPRGLRAGAHARAAAARQPGDRPVQRRHRRPAGARLARRACATRACPGACGRCPSPITTRWPSSRQGPVVIARNLVDPQRPTWHDPRALRDAFSGVLKLCRSRQK